MGKKFIALFLCMSLLVCSALTGCSTNTTADGHEVKIIRVAFNQNEDHPQYKAMRELGDKFEEATNGRYKMVIYPNGVLGEQGSMAEFIRTGALDMAIVPCSVPEGYDSDFAIVGAPYLYDDMDHLRRTTLSGAFDELFKSTRKFNFEVLTVYTAGERNIYANKPINTPDDLKGMIVRVNDSTTYLNMVKYMGGVGTAMSQSEVYTALQQGALDGQENPATVILTNNVAQVNNHLAMTEHAYSTVFLVMSPETWASFDDETKETFKRVMAECSIEEREISRKMDSEAVAELEKQGMTVTYPDKQQFIDKAADLYAQWEEQYGDMISEIRALSVNK